MNVLRNAVVTLLLVGLAGCGGSTTTGGSSSTNTPTTKDKLLGTWEVTKGDMPPGSTIEFTKEGKLKFTIKLPDGKTHSEEGTYEVDGESIKTGHKEGDKEVKETIKIKSLTDKELVTLDEKGKTDEFKKK